MSNNKIVAPEIKIIRNISNSYFSVARYAEKCTIHGREFVYIQDEDTLIRKDLLADYNKEKDGKQRIIHG